MCPIFSFCFIQDLIYVFGFHSLFLEILENLFCSPRIALFNITFFQFVYKNSTTFPQVGSDAPEFALQDLEGYWHYLSDYRGRVVYLEFNGMW